jgi:formylglycine-generating enzyme required for sulfatase activity
MDEASAVIFISHSSKNNEAAKRVAAWFKAQNFEVFLDLDPQDGMTPGQRWQKELQRNAHRCSAVAVLVSPDWVAAPWCRAEHHTAKILGKRVFPILIAPTDFSTLPHELSGELYVADLSDPAREAEEYRRLERGLRAAGLDPSHFAFPPPDEPKRPAYRGLAALEEPDAGIYFGRDSAITAGLDVLRRIRNGAPERLVAILGASGAGKSSFLRAGLLARLQRAPEHYLCLPAIRPERAALSGRRGLVAALAEVTGARKSEAEAANAAGADATLALLAQARTKARSDALPLPLIVIPVDQAEELFAADHPEAAAFLNALAALLATGQAVVLLTIRSDSFERLQTEPRLAQVPVLPFSLPPMPPASFKEVIEGPAAKMTPPVTVAPDLTATLLNELGQKDSLPLLAFALARIAETGARDGVLDLADYRDELKGLSGAINSAVEAAFAAAIADPALPNTKDALEPLARAAFLPWLVQVDGAAQAKRRVARVAEIPEASRPLLKPFVDQRLLVTDTAPDGQATVEVVHEAIFRHWPQLEGWIAAERGNLLALDGAARAAAEWTARGQSRAWLAHGGEKLAEAEALLARPDFAAAVAPETRAYLTEARAAESASKRVRRALVSTAMVLGAAIVVGSLSLAFQFEISRTWAQWTMTKRLSAGEIAALKPGDSFTECTGGLVCPTMVVIPPGDFLMGSPQDEPGRFADEDDTAGRGGNQVKVAIPAAFAVGAFEVTREQWEACVVYTKQEALQAEAKRAEKGVDQRVGCAPVSDSGFKAKDEREAARLPAINLDWFEAQAYVRWLNLMVSGDPANGPYRLLTEAEWEYAARGGTVTAYSYGDDPADICKHGNVLTAETKKKYLGAQGDPATCEDGFVETAPGGSFEKNPFGLSDMHGNVWEWVADCYRDSLADQPPDGRAFATGECSLRVLRGGSWNVDPRGLRSAIRIWYGPAYRNINVGFRLARTLSPPAP